MKRTYQVLAVIGLAFAAFVASQALGLRLMTRLGPGPGFFPFLLALLFGGLSILLFFRAPALAASGEAAPGDGERPDREGQIRILILLAAMVAAGFLIEPLGYCLTMLGFCAVALLTLGERRWYVLAPAALLGSFGVYFVFVRYLGVSLPGGILAI